MLAKLSNLRFNTAVGKKVLMAVTGLAMCIFLVGHLVGNLQLLWNQPQFDAYAHFLTISMKPVVIIMELGLLAILLVHVFDALALLKTNYAARPVGYHKKTWARAKSKKSRKSWASTLMMWSGTTILLFIVFHVWQMKFHNPVASPSPGYNAAGEYQLATMVVNELRNPLIAGIYMVSLTLLGMHLWHAVSSALHTVGVSNPRYQTIVGLFGYGFTIVVVGGFMLFPILIFTGILQAGVAPSGH
jgi:succinate dehydrogenase / fumarate reductase cytochrome b subunit